MAIFPAVIAPGAWDLWHAGGAFEIQATLLFSFYMSILTLAWKPPLARELERLLGQIFTSFDRLEEQAAFLPLKELPSLKETGLAEFYFEWLEHPDYDAFWQAREWALYEKLTVPSFLRTSWYDYTLRGTLGCYEGIKERGGSEQARKNLKLIIGPWIHYEGLSNEAGELNFGIGSAGDTIDLLGIQIRWFDYWLKPTFCS